MKSWVTWPVTVMTITVVITVITVTGRSIFESTPQTSISPTAAGMNMTGIIIAAAVVGIVGIVIGVLMLRLIFVGLNMIGINQDFARYSGMNVAAIIILSQVLGGALAGIGGGVEMLGRYSAYSWNALPGYGWTGITVAILAGNNPAFVPLAAFFMAYLNKGCSLMSTYCGVPSQLIDILQAVIFVFFAAKQFLAGYRQRLVVKGAQEELAARLAAFTPKKKELSGYLKRYAALVSSGAKGAILNV